MSFEGSSSSRISGFFASTAAIRTLTFSPPESVLIFLSDQKREMSTPISEQSSESSAGESSAKPGEKKQKSITESSFSFGVSSWAK